MFIKLKFNKKAKKEYSDKSTEALFTVIAIVCIILFCAVLAPITLQNDTFYTIKIGEHIMNTGKVDMMDPFSWHQGLPYTYPHWAYDVFIYLIYSLGGFTGVYISTVVFSCILGLSIFFTNTKISKNKLVSFLVTLGAMYMLKGYITARAQLVSFILLELTILFIEKFLDTKKPIYGIGIVLISILITNIHCAVWPFFFVLFLPYVVEYIFNLDYLKFYYNIKNKYFENMLKKFNNKQDEKSKKIYEKLNIKCALSHEKEIKAFANREKRRKNPYRIKMVKKDAVKWLILIMVICAFTGLLTPLGNTPYTYLYNTMQGNTTKSISEHLPLTLINDKTLVVVLAAIIALLVFTDTKIRLKDLFMLSGLALLMFMTRRQVSMFILFGSAIIAKIVSDIFNKYDKGGTLEVEKIATTTLGTFALILVIALFMFTQIREYAKTTFVNEKSYPVQAAKYIKENLDLSKIKLYNEYNYGSYLIFENIPVFIDSRADLYAPEFNKNSENPNGKDIFSDYINTSNISKYYEDTFNDYGITHIILYKNSKLSMLLSKQTESYSQIYSDDNFVIYERVTE